MNTLTEMGQKAKETSRVLATLNTSQKNTALRTIADEIETQTRKILSENSKDIAAAREKGHSEALIDRLLLTEKRVAALADDARRVAELPDPVGSEFGTRQLPNGMRLSCRRIPIGVLGVIYEARPNVTIDIATLAIKTGNTIILRGGSETLLSNLALVQTIQAGLEKSGIPLNAVQYIENPDRELVRELLQLDKYVDMIIPRGGSSLQRFCQEEGIIPVITGGIGICHIFVDQSADLKRAPDIIENAKVQRPSVCNSLDTLLVHRAIADEFLPVVAERLTQRNVELRVTEDVIKILHKSGFKENVALARPEDFDQEWLALILGIKIVEDIEEAIGHIHTHSTEHSDSILTSDWGNANRFIDEINSAAVFVNASTRFNDGGQFGLGAEVAISTQKLHARGPMGLDSLTTYKWICLGDGHIREE
jgi:glutamate-5-semialdehyde dehydrogenase